MLYITFPELMGRAQEQMLTYESGFCMDKSHHILQLITETEGAS